MNVVIPMMGIGKRFTDSGYYEDKPFIKVDGDLLIQKVVQPLFTKYGKIHVACRKEQGDRLSKVFSQDIVCPIILNNSNGAADTIVQSCAHIGKGPLLCVDADTIVDITSLDKIDITKNSILTFKDKNKTGIYSYIQLDENEKIVNIVEKIAISDIANAGVYFFSDKEIVINNYVNIQSNEQYLSSVVQSAIQNGVIFKSIDISKGFDCLGTPHQLQSYCKSQAITDKIFCFDLDMTLVYDVLNNQRPIQKNVDYCNYLYDNGAKIIIYTARGMKSNNGDVSKIKSLLEPLIIDVLHNCGIKYHELIIGKPYADFYIDDKGISSYRDLQKETGVYYQLDTEARAHHEIRVQSDRIIKSGKLSSEKFYYDNLPKNLLENNFPRIYSNTDNEIVLERINSPTYSQLMLNGTLNENDVIHLLNKASNIHNHVTISVNDWGYKEKVFDRYTKNINLYKDLGVCYDDILMEYNQINNSIRGGIIHGDLVFTNVFHDKFIDPRGSWDGKFSIFGDIHYDNAKVLQSLYGYDYALNNLEIQYNYLNKLRHSFFNWCKTNYGDDVEFTLKSKTKLLIYSMLPLHKEDYNRCKRFIDILKNII